jgi:hypothetical protein
MPEPLAVKFGQIQSVRAPYLDLRLSAREKPAKKYAQNDSQKIGVY